MNSAQIPRKEKSRSETLRPRRWTEAQLTELGRRNREAWARSESALAQRYPVEGLSPKRSEKENKVARQKKRAEAARAARVEKLRTMFNGHEMASENQECRVFLDWAALVRYRGEPLADRIVKIPNERGCAGAAIAILIGLGMRPGFQDYLVMAPIAVGARVYGGLLIEAKKARGVVRQDQIEWRERAIKFDYQAVICSSGLKMIEATRNYFRMAAEHGGDPLLDRTRIKT